MSSLAECVQIPPSASRPSAVKSQSAWEKRRKENNNNNSRRSLSFFLPQEARWVEEEVRVRAVRVGKRRRRRRRRRARERWRVDHRRRLPVMPHPQERGTCMCRMHVWKYISLFFLSSGTKCLFSNALMKRYNDICHLPIYFRATRSTVNLKPGIDTHKTLSTHMYIPHTYIHTYLSSIQFHALSAAHWSNSIPTPPPGQYPWPSLAEVNTRARRYISAWLKQQRRDEHKQAQLVKVSHKKKKKEMGANF